MYIKDVEDLLTYHETLRISDHALREAHKESLHAKDVLHAIFNGQVLEHYRDRKRVLIVGPIEESDLNLHVVCDYDDEDEDEIAVITVYIPDRPKWINDLVRGYLTPKTSLNTPIKEGEVR